MLTHLSIQNFALIETLALDFSDGLIIFTGETGAGKSIIMDALSAALGKRSDTTHIREGCEKSDTTAVFDISHHPLATDWLAENEFGDDSSLILRRKICRDGRSKAWINGQIVPLHTLKTLGKLLVVVHGQQEHQQLLESEGQRELLDQFGQLHTFWRTVKQHYQTYQALKKTIDQKNVENQQFSSQHAFISFQLEELKAFGFQAGELEKLEKEQKKLANITELAEGATAILAALNEEELALTSLLSSISNKLARLTELDEKLTAPAKLLDSALIQMKEASNELQHFIQTLEVDPNRLQEIDARLSRMYELARKHHVAPNELRNAEVEFEKKLGQFVNHVTDIAALEEKLNQSLKEYTNASNILSKKRAQASKLLGEQVTHTIQSLGMKGGKFEVTLQTISDNAPHPTGNEKIEFYVRTNPGSSLQPLIKIASGGELSRLNLAISSVAVEGEAPLTLIFDEIDSGIGGATASSVGQLLKKLSQYHQILCITHAPQVATFSKQHFIATKKIHKNSTQVTVTELNEKQKIEEIARMISGTKITKATMAHAKDLLENEV